MLRNVAIPLMLAASEAEAANPKIPPTAKQVQKALNEDRAAPFDGLIADALACTTATDTGAGSVDALSKLLTTAKEELKKAETAVTELTKTDGTWKKADDARKKAVDDAVAKEVTKGTDDIPGLIDKQDIADADERAKSKIYWDAKALWDVQTTEAAAAKKTKEAADATAGTMDAAHKTAWTAVNGINTQITDETKWRGWLYCELGAASGITDEANRVFKKREGSVTATQSWYNMTPGNGAATSAPDTCVIPALVGKRANTVTYFFKSSGGTDGTNSLLAATKNADYTGAKRWSATLAATEAKTAIEAPTATPANAKDSTNMDANGLVQFWTGETKRLAFVKEQNIRETAYYKYVSDKRVEAAGKTATWMGSATTSASFTPPGAFTSLGTTTLVLNGDNPQKKMDAADTAWADDATSGYKLLVGAARSDGSSGTEWDMGWKTTTASMDFFKAQSGSQKDTYKWQVKATVLSAKIAAWFAKDMNKYLDILQSGTVTNVVEKQVDGAKACDTTGWTAVANYKAFKTQHSVSAGSAITVDDAAKCKTACIAYTQYHLTDRATGEDTLVGNGGGLALASDYLTTYTGSAGFPKINVDGKFCAAYSWKSDATAECKIKIGTTGPSDAAATAHGSDNGKCFKMDGASADANATGAYLVLQKAVKAAWDDGLKSSDGTAEGVKQKAMRDAMGASATLQTAWMEAWYDKQYWKEVNTALGDTATPKKWEDRYTVLKAVTPTLETNSTGAGALYGIADGKKTSYTSSLSTLKLTKTNADTNKANLVDRIKNSTTEIETLLTFANGKSTDGVPSTSNPAILDIRYKTLLDAYTTYVKGVSNTATLPWGPQQTAIDALKTADAKVKANNFNGTTIKKTGDVGYAAGTQTKIVDVAKEELDAAVKLSKEAGEALTAKVTSAALTALRAKVTSEASLWKVQNDSLLSKQKDVDTKKADVVTATTNLTNGTVKCQVAKYDAYRATFESAMIKRGNDLATIKGLITTELTRPVTGDEGSRCEKALSNGTWRPDRAEESICVKDLCCGAARIWYASGATKDAAWRTIESCQPKGASKYKYQPPRAPMDITMPTKVEVNFKCIEGAQRLAVAATAMAAAAFMLA